MANKTATQLRTEFLKYFEKNGHQIVESSSLVPHNDPTLLFTNAGMNQFKDVFLGSDPRSYKRATTSQKCVRAGGKHNDLENVGYTARHHTFFEMLGNFSFGDYFKKDAIHFAWEFITKTIGLDKNVLYVTVYKDDDEAADIWHKQEGVPRERIFRFGEKDNFWAMGDTGPCGPCSEIFVDRGVKYSNGDPNETVGSEGDRFMEIWNLVFMQFNRDKSGNLTPLPKPSIDTGMGLERLASVIQSVDTNYDTDLFQALISDIAKLAKVSYGKSKDTDISLRVIADHARATNFLIADGVLPSNEGRGYVLRRIMRRAIRHGRNLGFRDPFFYKVSESLIKLMGGAYPEIKDKREFLETSIKLEEERFLITLENGLKVLEDSMGSTSKNKKITGETAFKLYDTFGFPLDLTQVIAREKGFSVDEEGFTKSMEAQRERSRENWKGSGEQAVDEIYKELHQKGLKTTFTGYISLEGQGKVLAIIEEGKLVDRSSTGSFEIVVDSTPFYAESGGQVGDHGEVRLGSAQSSEFKARAIDVQKPMGDLVVIRVDMAQGSLKVGATVTQLTDVKKRKLTAKNHTATHLLHHALRKYLGNHVKQAGSLVTPDLLRFDFNHTKPLTDDEMKKIENEINEKILLQQSVSKEEMDKDKAMAKGAIAFFGDKYGAKVRVVSVGESVEFCGGTHVDNTSDIQSFKILNENGIAAGVRRITAITGPAVVEQLREKDALIDRLMQMMKASAADELPIKIEKLQAAEKDLRKSLEAQSRKSMAGDVDSWIQSAAKTNSGSFIKAIVDINEGDAPAKVLRDLADLIRSKVNKSVIALAAKDKSKNVSSLLVAVTKDLSTQVHAGDIVKKVAPILEGTGGGKPDLAQAGGKNFKFDEVFQAIQSGL